MGVEQTLKERGNTHGSFADNAQVSQDLKAVVEVSKNWSSLTPIQREALHMILHKIARIVSGNPNEPDHWRDCAGYATLAENEASQGVDNSPKKKK